MVDFREVSKLAREPGECPRDHPVNKSKRFCAPHICIPILARGFHPDPAAGGV